MYERATAEGIASLSTARFAHFSVTGTWVYRREPCKTCGYYWQETVAPLLVQWEPSSEMIGDFSWDGPFGYVFVVKSGVAEMLHSMHLECRFLPVDYVKPDRKRSTVPFPYDGPTLLWGQCTETVNVDMKASQVNVESSCSECGDVRYTFRDSGIIVRRKQMQQLKMFRIATNGPALTFVTEEGRRLIENAALSNIAFSEAGQIIE